MKKQKYIKTLFGFFLTFLFYANNSIACTGDTYYISNGGNDSAAGSTPATSWASISKVNSSSFSPGDCILFNRGDTWNERLLVPSSGNVGNPITFGAYGTGNKPVFDGTGLDLPANHGIIRGDAKNYIIVDNIRVQNSGIGDVDENTGIGFNGGSNIIVQNCEVNNTESSGIKLNNSSNVGVFYNDVTMTNCNSWSEQISLSNVDGFEVAYNESYENCNPGAGGGAAGTGIDSKQGSKNGTIHHNIVRNLPSTNGIYVDAWNADTFNIEVYNNYIYDVGRGGIVIGSEAGGALHNVTVHHNIVERAARGGLVFHNEGTTGNNVYDIFIYNNTLNFNGTNGTNYYGGVRIFDTLLTGVTFKNNILSNAHNFQIGVDGVDPGVVTLDRNVIYGANVDTGGFTHLDGTNTISSNPLFVDAPGGNFHLQSSSPARNACDNSVWQGVPNITDYDGTAITDGSGNIVAPGGTVSCGALEYTVTSSVATTYYVTSDGNDNCSGTSQIIGASGDCAWKTLAKVSSSSFSPGDNIYFKRGDTWNERLLVPSSGNAGNPITFGAYGTGNKPVFDGTGVSLPTYHGLIRGDNKNYIIVSDIRIQNSGIGAVQMNPGIGFLAGTGNVVQRCEINNTESAGIKFNNGFNAKALYNDVTMTNCNDSSEQISISNVDGFEVAYNDSHTNCNPFNNPPGGAGIDAKQGSKNGTIHHNEVWDLEGVNGIYVDAYNLNTSDIQVYNNYVHDIGKGGIVIGAEAGGALHNVLIHHNIITRATWGGIIMHNVGTSGNAISDIKFYNNTLYMNGTNGSLWLGGVRIIDQLLATNGATFKNNIFTNAHNFQIGYDATRVQPSDIVMDYNVVYGPNFSPTGGFTTLTGSNAILNDPLFTNAAASDFTLQSSSPARNACDNSVWQGVPNITDYDGTAITDGSGNIVVPGGTVSCGALEYTSEATVIRGDVDGSSQITTTDALLTLRNSLGLSMTDTAWQISATTGDVDCNGVTNSTDALLILRHSIGLDMGSTAWCEG